MKKKAQTALDIIENIASDPVLKERLGYWYSQLLPVGGKKEDVIAPIQELLGKMESDLFPESKNVIRAIKTASGKTKIKISQKAWVNIGKKKGWL